MPTILREQGFVIGFYSDEHPPAHVHVRKGQHEVKIELGDAGTKPYVKGPSRMPMQDIRRALEIVGRYQEHCLKAWREFHG